MSSSVNNQNVVRVIGVNEKIGVGSSLFLGLQSVLACNLFLGPVVLIAAMSLNNSDATALITLTFLACGIASAIQSGLFLKYPIIQGMSFASIGAVLAISAKADFATCFGSIMISSVIVIILGYLRIFSKLVKIFVPPLVAGTVIVVIGISLMYTSWSSLITAQGNQNINFLEAGFSFVILLIMIQLGKHPSRMGKILRSGCVIYTMILGTIFSSFFGNVDLSTVAASPWVGVPDVFHFGLPKFDFSVSLVMVFILFVVFIESLGSWFTVSVLANETMSDKQIDKGVVGEGIGSFLGALFSGVPVTSYGTNAGVIAVTKVLSRYTAVGAGAICVVMAFCPKLMNLIACVPTSVIWGVFLMMTALITQSGLGSVHKNLKNERDGWFVGIVIMITVGSSMLPADVIAKMPTLVSYLFGSSICIGSLAAVIVNKVLPRNKAMEEDAKIKLKEEDASA